MTADTRTGGAPAALLPEAAAVTGTRRRLFEAALTLFAERGYHGVSVRDILARLDMRGSALYGHVSSKQELLFELIKLGHQEHRDQIRRALLEAGSDPVEQVRAVTRAHVLMHAGYPLLARVANRELAALAPDQLAVVLVARGDAEQILLDVVERGMRLGVFRPGDARLAVAAIGAMGIRVAEWWNPQLGVPAETVGETFADYAVRLLT